MGTSLKIAKLFGIPIFLHWTFGLIFVYVIGIGQVNGWGIWQTVETTFLFLALFVCVVFHEFGHALTARRYGVQTRDIILSPIGGIARLTRLPEKPIQEFLVAIAGPAVNIVIALLLSPFLLLHSMEEWQNMLMATVAPESNFFVSPIGPIARFIFTLILLNITLAIFNLLPAFPMDGGRVLRALLSIKLGRVKATRVASLIGQALAIALVFYGLSSGSYITAFIGVFIFLTASGENRMVRMEAIMTRHRVAEIMRPNYTKLYTSDNVNLTLQLVRQGLEKNFLVFDQWNNIRGTITENDLIQAAKSSGLQTTLAEVLRPGYTALLEEDNLQDVFYRIQERDEKVLPVFRQNKLMGLVDVYSFNHFLSLQAKLKK